MQSLPGGDLLLRSDRQKLDAFIRRGVRLKFYSHDDPTMAELADELDKTLFTAVLMIMCCVTFYRIAATIA